MKGYIYKLKSPSGKCYVGQTIDINKRFSDYKTFHHCQHQKILFSAIKKYGWDSFEKEIIETIENDNKKLLQEELNLLEIYYIELYDTINNGYNICRGGNQYRLGVKESEEQRQKKRDAWTQERRQLRSEIWKSDINPRKNNKSPQINTEKAINQYTLDGVYLRTWKSTAEAAREHNEFWPQNITKCCKGKIKSAYNYIWKYTSDCNSTENIEGISRINNGKPIPVKQYSLENVFIKEWPSMSEASESLSISIHNISSCCKGGRKSAGGFIWKK